MQYTIQAACGCHIGKVRRNNEDNFFFGGRCMEQENTGLRSPVMLERPLKENLCLAVFDGMGGENFGEIAAFSAARALQSYERSFTDYVIPGKNYLSRLALHMNGAVVKAAEELSTTRMGTTLAALYFTAAYAYVCNVGDSRVYRLRDREFFQMSCDHVDSRPVASGRKPGLTQYLGVDPEEMQIEPFIAKGRLKAGDQYLICSDGLTDMLSNFEIADIMLRDNEAEICVQELIQAALNKGGRDNITAIICKIL